MSDDVLPDRVERYLVDPDAPPVEEVAALERALAPLRHRPRPLEIPSERRRPRRRVWLAAAAAALVLLAAGAAAAWVWTWPAGRSWPVLAGPESSLEVGEPVRLEERESLVVRVARIGWMEVDGGSSFELISTRSNRHRLSLEEGRLRVGVWAPPGSVGIRTRAGEVLDLGCELVVEADETTTRVDVLSGWGHLENARGETLAPAGASSTMVAGRRPSVAVFRDADPRFRAAVRRLEAGGETESAEAVVATARPRDAYTLLLLAIREPAARRSLVERTAELAQPSSSDLVTRALAGDREAIWAWVDELPLPPPKRWFPNWRDWRPSLANPAQE